jgi:hypothetical protein
MPTPWSCYETTRPVQRSRSNQEGPLFFHCSLVPTRQRSRRAQCRRLISLRFEDRARGSPSWSGSVGSCLSLLARIRAVALPHRKFEDSPCRRALDRCLVGASGLGVSQEDTVRC